MNAIPFDSQFLYRSKEGALLPSADHLQRKLIRSSMRRKLLAYRHRQQQQAHQLKQQNHFPPSSTSIIIPSPRPPMHPRTRRIKLPLPPPLIPLSTSLLPCTRFRPPPCIDDDEEEEKIELDDSPPPAKRSRIIHPHVLPNHLRPLFFSPSIAKDVYNPDDPPLRLEWNESSFPPREFSMSKRPPDGKGGDDRDNKKQKRDELTNVNRSGQRSDRPCWTLPSATPISCTPVSASFSLKLTRPANLLTESVIAEIYADDDGVGYANWYQECNMNEYLARMVSTIDRRKFIRERILAALVPPKQIRTQMQLQFSANQRQQHSRLSARWRNFPRELYYRSYSGTLESAVHRSSSTVPLSTVTANLRTALFWSADSAGLADPYAMECKSAAFIIHCMQCLQLHHRTHILLGDIQPSHFFYSDGNENQPVYGNYTQATRMDQVDNGTSRIISCDQNGGIRRKGRINDNYNEKVNQIDRDFWLSPISSMWSDIPLPPFVTTSIPVNDQVSATQIWLVRSDGQSTIASPLSSLHSVLHELDSCNLRQVMAGLVRSEIGSSLYRAPEAQTTPIVIASSSTGDNINNSAASTPRAGFYSEASDVYSLCATLVDILCGHDRHVDSYGTRDNQFESLRKDCVDERTVSPLTLEQWQMAGAPACVSVAIAAVLEVTFVRMRQDLTTAIDKLEQVALDQGILRSEKAQHNLSYA